ncbi:Homeodomain-like protein [Geopyxis carbonaria]|nr:Homeodomain-like protein [Geopyxis carbonaria]
MATTEGRLDGQRDQRRWTPAEDALLREGFRIQAAAPTGKGRTVNWNEIAKMIPRRSNKDCRKRYYNKLAGCLKKGPWTGEEDCRLRRYVQQYGLSWAVVAQKMENRSADQCSKRWHHSLDPELERRPWTEIENQTLLVAVATHGNSWKDIRTVHFPTKSANNVKNQYTILSRKSNSIPQDAPPCCQPHGYSTPNSENSADTPPSHISSPAHIDYNTPLDEDISLQRPTDYDTTARDNFFTLLNDTTGAPDLRNFDQSLDWWSNTGSDEMGSLFSPPDLLEMPNLELQDFQASSMAGISMVGTPATTDLVVPMGFKPEDHGQAPMDMDYSPLIGAIDTTRSCSSDDGIPSDMILVHNNQSGLDELVSRARSASDPSRITITIDDAQPDTVMGVMQVLVGSRAKVQVQHG